MFIFTSPITAMHTDKLSEISVEKRSHLVNGMTYFLVLAAGLASSLSVHHPRHNLLLKQKSGGSNKLFNL